MARSGAKPWRKPEPEPEPEPKPEPDPEPKREPELPEPEYRRQGWRAHCACAVRAASAPCVRTVCARRQLASQPRAAPHNPAQLLTALTACRSPVPPLQAVSIELRNQPAFCRDEDRDVLVEAPAPGRLPSPQPEPERNPHPNSNQVPSFGQVRLDIAHGRMSQGVSSMRPVASQSVGSRSVSSL